MFCFQKTFVCASKLTPGTKLLIRNSKNTPVFMGESLEQILVGAGKKGVHPVTKKVLGHDIAMVKISKHLVATKSQVGLKTPGGLALSDVMNEVIEWPCKLVSYQVVAEK